MESTLPLNEVIYRNKYNNTNIIHEFYVVPSNICMCIVYELLFHYYILFF